MSHLKCSHEGCSKAPSFGFPGGGRSTCSSHKRPGMQYLKHGEGDDSSSTSQTHVPRGLDYAPSVQRDPTLNRRHEAASNDWATKAHCRHADCAKAPSFGFPNGERVFCSAHKRPGMEYLAGAAEHHRGGAGDALTQAMGHIPTGLDYHHSTEKHQQHARAAPGTTGAVTAVADGKHCQEGGCTKAPSYGWESAPGGKPVVSVMCALHKRPAMVYLRHSSDAAAAGGASSSSSGKHTPSKDHVPRGLEYIPSVTMESDRVVHSDHPHCIFKGCTKAPSYGLDGQTGTYCFSHKRAGMVFLKRGPRSTAPVEAERKVLAPTKPAGNAQVGRKTSHEAVGEADGLSDSLPIAPSATTTDVQHPQDGAVVEADLVEARRCVALAQQRLEDASVAIKYLSNILKHPDDAKYRTLNVSNRKFYSEVWLNSGMRGIFLALGFRQRGTGMVVLDPLASNTLECTATVLQELSAGKDGTQCNTVAGKHATGGASWNSHRSPMG